MNRDAAAAGDRSPQPVADGSAGGPALFARFAYPPNALGLCGPHDHAALLQAVAEPGVEAVAELRHLAAQFTGAWPYLQLIAAANSIEDPLDERVVAAYWIGNNLLAAVPASWLADQAEDRFRRIAGPRFGQVTTAVLHGGRPHHNFHVFNVYPWVGLLRGDRTGEPLRVLDRCRIRPAQVQAVEPAAVTVATTKVVWDGEQLGEQPHMERLIWQRDGYHLGARPQVGEWVAAHWDWVCQPITPSQAATLSRWTQHHLAIANLLRGADG